MSMLKQRVRVAMRKVQHHRCFYCMKEFDENGTTETIDHFVPISVGGKKKCVENIVLSCYKCNRHKGDEYASFREQDRHLYNLAKLRELLNKGP